MENQFFTQPILNSPYAYPGQHWELDEQGQPTHRIRPWRRPAEFVSPIPKPKKTRGQPVQPQLGLEKDKDSSGEDQQYALAAAVN